MRRILTLALTSALTLSGLASVPAQADTTYDPNTGTGTVDCFTNGTSTGTIV